MNQLIGADFEDLTPAPIFPSAWPKNTGEDHLESLFNTQTLWPQPSPTESDWVDGRVFPRILILHNFQW